MSVSYPKGNRADILAQLTNSRSAPPPGFPEFNDDEPEFQTDKDAVKVVPCTGCHRPLVVNSFYTPARAICSACGGTRQSAKTGTSNVVQAGRTEPSKASNLNDCLINPSFSHAICPINSEHVMELKLVNHNPNYGPTRLVGYDKSGNAKRNNSTGELVMHQCLTCNTVVTYATTSVMQYRRQNEPRTVAGDRPPAWDATLQIRSDET